MLSYEELFTGFRKGIRHGNWKMLRFLDKALYRAAMWYVKRGGRIVNKSPFGESFDTCRKTKRDERQEYI